MKSAALFLAGILLLVFPVGCRMFEEGMPSEDIETPDIAFGGLVIDFGDVFGNSRATLTPPTDIVTYTIDGELEGGGDGFHDSVDAGMPFHRNGLTPGLWTITVGGVNTNGVTIVEGSTTAQITAGSVTPVTLTLTLVPGNGVLDLTVTWDKKLFGSDDIQATLIPEVTQDGILLFEIKTNAQDRVGTYRNESVPAGYYLLTLKLIGDTVVVWGFPEAVRILANETTIHTYTYPYN